MSTAKDKNPYQIHVTIVATGYEDDIDRVVKDLHDSLPNYDINVETYQDFRTFLSAAASATGGYVIKKASELVVEYFKKWLETKPDAPRVVISIYGPHSKVLAEVVREAEYPTNLNNS
jgi:hypothetical protein